MNDFLLAAIAGIMCALIGSIFIETLDNQEKLDTIIELLEKKDKP